MKLSKSVWNILFIWLGWAIILLCFQSWVQMRVNLERPDSVLDWTSNETTATSNSEKFYLADPFLHGHVAWDSEFYLAIADQGYNAAKVRAVPGTFSWTASYLYYCRANPAKDCYSLNYAFFPVYPLLIRLVAFPLKIFAISRVAQLTLAAVIVSLLGALAAMLALYSMTRKSLGEEGGVRAAFYLLIFPSGFFLAQVYSEGVFIGITFTALAFLFARKWGWAALFAALAVWTRPGGAILVLPMIIFWIMEKTWKEDWKTAVLRGLAALSPAISYGVWSLTPLAERFFRIESLFFGRGLLKFQTSFSTWTNAFQTMMYSSNSSTIFYYGLEFAAILLGVVTCLLLVKERPDLALFGLAMITFAFTSASAQGMIRYVLVAPPIFWMLARWGKNQVFDRAWTLVSILLMGLEVMLFTFDFWVA